MRAALAGSFLLHATALAAVWGLTVSGPAAAAGPGAALLVRGDESPLPEPPLPEPPLLRPPPLPDEILLAEPAPEEPDLTAFRLPAEARLEADPLPRPRRLAVPLPAPASRSADPVPLPEARAPLPTPSEPRRSTPGPLQPPEPIASACPQPPYPERARRAGLEGAVLLELTVAAGGAVTGWKVVESSGHDLLDRAAARQARRWRFEPATRDGRSVASTYRVRFLFRLDG